VLTGHCTLGQYLNIIVLSELPCAKDVGKKRNLRTTYFVSARLWLGKMEIFGSAWLELTDIKEASMGKFLAIVLRRIAAPQQPSSGLSV
jgi:hypothetical protein